MSDLFTISKEFTFSASHQLAGLPLDHPCSRLHGHNYTVRLELTGALNEVGFVVDYRELDVFKAFLDNTLDHQHLNGELDFNPTAERLAHYLSEAAGAILADHRNVIGGKVHVSETPKTWATSFMHIPTLGDSSADEDRYRWGTVGRGEEG